MYGEEHFEHGDIALAQIIGDRGEYRNCMPVAKSAWERSPSSFFAWAIIETAYARADWFQMWPFAGVVAQIIIMASK